jgi:hypothetical protein
MLSSELHYKIINIGSENISINGFNYLRVNVLLPGDIPMAIYIGEKHMSYIKIDEYFFTKRAYLTSSYVEGDNKGGFSFRIDFVSESSKKDFDDQNGETVVNFNARIGKKPRDVIKYLGPMRIPTYSIRAALKNEVGEMFHVLVVGFHSKAKVLDNLCTVCYVDITGSISAPKKSDKPCAIVLKEYTLRKEVKS